MLFPWCIRNDKYLAINSTSKLKLDTWIFLWICLISKTKFVFELIHWKYLHKAQYAERQNSVLFHLYMWPRYSCLLTEIWGGHTDRHTRYYTYTSIYIILHANNVYMYTDYAHKLLEVKWFLTCCVWTTICSSCPLSRIGNQFIGLNLLKISCTAKKDYIFSPKVKGCRV